MEGRAPLPVQGPRTALLGTEALRNHLGDLLARPPARLLIVSAYVTRIGVEWLSEATRDAAIDCDIVARWSSGDLLSGASDIEGCRLAMARGWRFHVLPDLHAKVTLVDETDIVVGSANLTGAGMSLVPAYNREFGLAAKASPEDVLACRGLLDDAVLVTQPLLEEIAAWVADNRKKELQKGPAFPDVISVQLATVPTRLFTAELPWLAAPELVARLTEPDQRVSGSLRHDVRLLGLEPRYATREDAVATIVSHLVSSRFWRWLVNAVRSQPDHEIRYGAITSLLHGALCDDPRPYRQDVKALVSNLYSYAEMFGCGLKADRPNYSQRLAVVGGA
ncbi:MAG: phospholipase D family protein [Aurantimonas endophytica]|uniref:phospholipase D family protein n=1 Tax=Aurantimonas endophytica TaxID=1522175 RepID=UPI003001D0B9